MSAAAGHVAKVGARIECAGMPRTVRMGAFVGRASLPWKGVPRTIRRIAPMIVIVQHLDPIAAVAAGRQTDGRDQQAR